VCAGGALEENAYSINVPVLDDGQCGQINQATVALGRLCAGYHDRNIGLCKVVHALCFVQINRLRL